MITAFSLRIGLGGREVESPDELAGDVRWVDVVAPSSEERAWIRDTYGKTLADLEVLKEIEASSRFFEDEEGTHVRALFLHERSGELRNVNVAFLLAEDRLFTCHGEPEMSLSGSLEEGAIGPEWASDATGVLLRLFEAKIDGLADRLERLYTQMERIDRRVFDSGERDLERLISELASRRDICEKLGLNLMDTDLVLSIMSRRMTLPSPQTSLLLEILRDTDSLRTHSSFLFGRMDALLNEIMGRISIEQNKIIKVLSVAAIVFLPPTLIASLYGMNFRHMPELGWALGYPLAVAAILLSALLPYLLFRWKRWL